MIYENCRDGSDRAHVQNVNAFAAAAVPIPHRANLSESAISSPSLPLEERAGERRPFNAGSANSMVRALALGSLCLLVAISAPAVNPASKVKISVNAGKVVLTWTGDPGVLYQAQGATSLSGQDWQFIDAPTTSSSVTSLVTAPTRFYRVGIFTNMDPFTTYAKTTSTSGTDKAAPTVPTSLTGSAPTSGQVNLSWNASTDLG